MPILYHKECLHCYNYQGIGQPSIDKVSLDEKQSWQIISRENNILVVLEGEFNFSLENYPDQLISEGQMLAIPSGCNFEIKANRGSTFLLLKIAYDQHLTACLSMEKLMKEGEKRQEHKLYLLSINNPFKIFLDSLNLYIEEGLKCHSLYEYKIKEMFFIFRSFYTKEDLYDFFYLHLTSDLSFSDFIYKNYEKIKSVNEFAKLQNTSISTFQRRFLRVFGTSPNKWMQEQKAVKVFRDIQENKLNTKEICSNYGFYSPAHLHAFCKKHFGHTLKQLRSKENLNNE